VSLRISLVEDALLPKSIPFKKHSLDEDLTTMNTPHSPVSKTRVRLLAAVASVAIAGAIGLGAVTTGTVPVLAEAVRVDGAQVPSFADVVEKVSPAVVSVRVKARMEPAIDDGANMLPQDPGFDQLPDNHPLKKFFREFRGDGNGGQFRQFRGGRDQQPRPSAQGSGFFISEDGYIVTNNHVVDGGQAFTVVTDGGKELDAKLIGTDPKTDLAVLKVDSGDKFTYVNFADDSKVRVGDWVVAVGNPFGLGGTVTAGIVSARGRDIGAGPYDDFIQIDAAVNHGNSGGPDFNLNGEVVGINTAIFSPSGGNVGIAFAIPASTARDVVKDLMTSGTVDRGWLGVQIQPVNEDIADSLGMTGTKGALVSEAQDGGPGKAAGIKAGDVITAVDGKAVDGPRELARIIGNTAPGKDVEITLWRNGKPETVKLTLGELKPDQKQASLDQEQAEPEQGDTLDDFGLTVTKSEDGNGIVVTEVEQGSPAEERGLQPGDTILAVNSTDVGTASDFEKAVADAAKSGKKAVLVQVSRDDSSRFVALPVAKS
jgi:serine protease Do